MSRGMYFLRHRYGSGAHMVETVYRPATDHRGSGHRCTVWVLMPGDVGLRRIESMFVPMDYSASNAAEQAAREALRRTLGGGGMA